MSNRKGDLRSLMKNKSVLSHIPNKSKPLSRDMIASSPIKRLCSYPSPSPDRTQSTSDQTQSESLRQSKSSPIRKKKVMFCHNITGVNKFTRTTPRKSILKQSLKPVTISAQDEFLSSPTKADAANSPNKADFWLPGQIARIPTNINNVQDELISFKSLLHGGLLVLEPVDSSKQFEVYATLNLLLKDLTDGKRLSILLTYLNDLLRTMKRDLINLEQYSSVLDKDPFKTRIYVQIIKLLSLLFSNAKLTSSFWKSTNENVEFFKWIIQHSCSLIMKFSISKSLLIANLQLLKEQKLNSIIPLALQEQILFAILNFKTFNNSNSLIIEKLNIIKQLILNYPSMMEKNCKNWLPFIFKTLIDSLTSSQLKTLQSITAVLLESCSQYLTSKPFNFEITANLKSEVQTDFQIESPEAQYSPGTNTIFSHITKKLSDNLTIDNCELTMLIWLSLTLSYFNNSDNLSDLNQPWLNVCLKCTILPNPREEIKPYTAAMNAWKSIIYVLANGEDILYDNIIFKMLRKMLSKRVIIENKELDIAITTLMTRTIFGISNCRVTNPSRTASAFKTFLSTLNDTQHNETITGYVNELLNTIFQNRQLPNNNRGGSPGLYLVLQTEPMKLTQLEPIQPVVLFQNHDFFWNLFQERVWKNDSVAPKFKLAALSGIMSKVRLCINNKAVSELPNFENDLEKILHKYEDFIVDYAEKVRYVSDPMAKVEHFNRLTILLKTNFGSRITTPKYSFYERMMSSAITHKVRTNDVLRFIIQQNRSSEYLILEKIFFKFYKKCMDTVTNLETEDYKIISFIGNNLESKIFMKNLNGSEIKSILAILTHLPIKSVVLLTNVLTMLMTNDQEMIKSFDLFLNSMALQNWSVSNLFNLVSCVDAIKGAKLQTKESLKKVIISQVQEILQDFNEDYIVKFFQRLSDMKLTKNDIFMTQFFVANNEYFYYHLIDPKDIYQDTVFTSLLEKFKLYTFRLVAISNRYLVSLSELDRLLNHGLNLCYNLNATSNISKPSILGKKLANRVLSVYLAILDSFIYIEDKNWQFLKSVNVFIHEKLRVFNTVDNVSTTIDKTIKGIKLDIVINNQELAILIESGEKQTYDSNDRSTQVIQNVNRIIPEFVNMGADAYVGDSSLNGDKPTQVIENPGDKKVDSDVIISIDETYDESDEDPEEEEDAVSAILSKDELIEGEKDSLTIDGSEENSASNQDSLESISNGSIRKSSVESDVDEIETSQSIKEHSIESISDGSTSQKKKSLKKSKIDRASSAEIMNPAFYKSTAIELTAQKSSEENTETLEVHDSNPPLNKLNHLSSQPIASDATDIDSQEEESAPTTIFDEGLVDDEEEISFSQSSKEINIDVPFSYSGLDSSPLRHRRPRSIAKHRTLRESPVPLSSSPTQNDLVQDSIQVIKKRRLEESTKEENDSRLLGSPTKRGRYQQEEPLQVSKVSNSENSPDKFSVVSRMIADLETEASSDKLTQEEAHAIETRLLQLMLKLRGN